MLTATVILFVILSASNAEFSVPGVILEAYSPKGFRAYIFDISGIELFGFHGKLNEPIGITEPGAISGDVTKSTDGLWIYHNPNLELKVGDTINYWIFVQHLHLGYRKDNLEWKVKELKSGFDTDKNCKASVTLRAGVSQICSGISLLEDNFDDKLDNGKWIREQYIPNGGPDYEFVLYTKDPSVTYLKGGQLFIKPKVESDVSKLRETVDLKNGCTRQKDECYMEYGLFYRQPIESGKITSALNFAYGEIEIKAKLPAGDWIYPQIYLEDTIEPENKIWIAYARGNANLQSADKSDFGSSLIFAGPVTSSSEPNRSKHLISKRFPTPLSDAAHVYTLKWTQNSLHFSVDQEEFGVVNQTISNFKEGHLFRLVLGVGVGGINDFPNRFISNGVEKPWENKERNQVKKFYMAKDIWYPTWTSPELVVDYVKIKTI